MRVAFARPRPPSPAVARLRPPSPALARPRPPSPALTRPPSSPPAGELVSDLHDRPERMLAKGVIREIVPWKACRTYFYWRLKRRLAHMHLAAEISAARPSITADAAMQLVASAIPSAKATTDQKAYEALATLTAKSVVKEI